MNKTKTKTALSWRTLIKRFLFLLLFIFIVAQIWFFLHVCWFNFYNPNSTAIMSQQLTRLQQNNPKAQLQHHWVALNKISRHLQRAVIAAEDAKFKQHHGFDWQGIKLAYQKNLKHGKIVAGGSTISQQLAKNLFLSNRKTPWRKGQEIIITLMLELVMDKQRILELYLNMIEWGDGVFGAQAASKHYYQRSAAQLSRWQSAKLAAMLPNPRYYDKHRQTAFLAKKTRTLLRRMPDSQLP